MTELPTTLTRLFDHARGGYVEATEAHVGWTFPSKAYPQEWLAERVCEWLAPHVGDLRLAVREVFRSVHAEMIVTELDRLVQDVPDLPLIDAGD